MNFRLLLYVIFITLLSISVKAQDTLIIQDIETWAGFDIEKKLFDKKFKLKLSQEFRFNNNSTQLKEYFTEGSLQFDLTEDLSIGGGYRFTKINEFSETFKSKHRFHIDAEYMRNIKRWKPEIRFRYQLCNDSWFDNSLSDYSVNKYRLKLEGSYNIKNWKLDPYMSSEIFYVSKTDEFPFLDDQYTILFKNRGFEKLRLTLGSKYKIKNVGRLKFFIRYEHEFGELANKYDLSQNFYIIGLNYKFSF